MCEKDPGNLRATDMSTVCSDPEVQTLASIGSLGCQEQKCPQPKWETDIQEGKKSLENKITT